MSLCLAFAILLYEDSDGDYGSVYTIQQGLLWQSVPAYVFGLYTNLSAKSVLAGSSLGLLTCIILISVVFSNEGAHDPFPLVDKSWTTFLGIAVNVIVSLSTHFVLSRNATTDTEKTEAGSAETSESEKKPLSLDDIRQIMKGINEPMTQYYGALAFGSMAMTIIPAFHWIGKIDPELEEDYGRDYAEEIMYNGEVRNVIGGLPDYIFGTLMWYLVAVGVGIVATLQWDVKAADGTPNSKAKKQHVAQNSGFPITDEPEAGARVHHTNESTTEVEMGSAGNGETE